MQKLLNKKLLGKKGFTLAELLVVIAILAILIAIAVPVFTHMVAEANLRVNQANVHSVRSAAVAHILTHLGEDDDSGDGVKFNAHIGEPKWGWVAVAKVDNNGNISGLEVFVAEVKSGTAAPYTATVFEGISTKAATDNYFTGGLSATNGWFTIDDDVSAPFATVKPSMNEDGAGSDNVYYVQAVVTDLKEMD